MEIVMKCLNEEIERIQDVIKWNKKPQSYDFSEETIDKLKDALHSIVITQTYLKQVDKLLGDDIGESEFIENLISNLKDTVYIYE